MSQKSNDAVAVNRRARFDYEVEETGERGYGCSEYSIIPPYPRWRY